MDTYTWTRTAIALVILFVFVARARGQSDNTRKLRGESPFVRELIGDAFDRSATFRSLVNRIEQSDAIVYVKCHRFPDSSLEGRTYLVPNQSHVRYVFVEIACPMPYVSAIAIIAHELRHAVEIASVPSVVDTAAMSRLYSEIGFLTCEPDRRRQRYETKEAIEIGARVRSEFLRADARTRHRLGITNTDY